MKQTKFFKITLIYFISLVLFVGLRILFQLNVFRNLSEFWQEGLSSFAIQIVLMLFLPFMLYSTFFKKKPKETLSDMGFKKISFKAVLLCFLIGIIAFILNIAVASVFEGIIKSLGYNPSSSGSAEAEASILNFFLQVLTVSILPAVCEEFMHRGILLRGLSKSIGVKSALIISSLLFGLTHLNIAQFFYASILGLLIGFVSVVGKSIWPAIIIHFSNNFLSTYLTFAKANSWIGGNFYDAINAFLKNNNFLFAIVVVIVILLILVVLLFNLILQLLKISSFDSFKKVLTTIKGNLNTEIINYNKPSEAENDIEYLNDVTPIILENLPVHDNMIDTFLNDTNKEHERLVFKDKIFLIASFILGGLITIFTFIWGVLWWLLIYYALEILKKSFLSKPLRNIKND